MSQLVDLHLALRVKLSCGCAVRWDPSYRCWLCTLGHGCWSDLDSTRHVRVHDLGLKPEHVAAGFAMAAARGVGPWAPYFPHKLLGTDETLPEALDAIGRELVGGL